jgi:hypothetical protein
VAVPSRLPATHAIIRDVASIIDTLIEARSVEYKQSAQFTALEPHLVKTAMALSNLRGGGYIVVGVTSASSGLKATGIDAADLATYDPDNVLSAINKFASPAVSAIVAVVQHDNRDYLVIKAQEFERTPTLCSRDGSWLGDTQKIAAGSIFIRPPGLVETRLPKNAAELEEVIELAAEKRAAQMIRQRDVLNAALTALPSAASAKETAEQTQQERYDRELGNDVRRL